MMMMTMTRRMTRMKMRAATLLAFLLYSAATCQAWKPREEKLIALDSLRPRVHAEYRLLRPPDDWGNHDSVISEEVTDIGGEASGERRRKGPDLPATASSMRGRRREEMKGSSGEPKKSKELLPFEYVLAATYEIHSPEEGSAKANETSAAGKDAGRARSEAGENDLSGGNWPSSSRGEKEEEKGERYEKPHSGKRRRSAKRPIAEGKIEDIFSMDFTLGSGEVSVPCWWLPEEGDHTAATFLTATLLDADVFENPESRDEQISIKFGSQVLSNTMQEEVKAEVCSGLPRDGTDDVWDAMEELRRLWDADPAVSVPPAASSDPSPGRLPDDRLQEPFREQICSKDPEVLIHEPDYDRERSSKVFPDAFYLWSNFSKELYPGRPSLSHESPASCPTSPWHRFRLASSLYKPKTDYSFPVFGVATFQLNVSICRKSFTDRKQQYHEHTNRSKYSPGRERGQFERNEIGESRYVVVDVTSLLKQWLVTVDTWERRRAKLSLVMFTHSHARTARSRSGDKVQRGSDALNAWKNISEGTQPLPNKEGEGKRTERRRRRGGGGGGGGGGGEGGDEEEAEAPQETLTKASLDCLLRLQPPRMSLNYWMDGKWPR
ncbi:uncharacterized protein LOC119568152 [Penaeus monodon]|uniref:uncharacterized protein LOC119568152 n=1 Tax=Penaeus monodon TaxID=6687 RepID=UPI0018A77FAB|nr:uncharacterized protein LOC119568152 [Penaeus monodon]